LVLRLILQSTMVSKCTTCCNIKKISILLTERIYMLRADSYGKHASQSWLCKGHVFSFCGVGTKVFGILHEV
jgi:hypothetical protein